MIQNIHFSNYSIFTNYYLFFLLFFLIPPPLFLNKKITSSEFSPPGFPEKIPCKYLYSLQLLIAA